MNMNGFEEYTVVEAIRKYPRLKYKLPIIILEDDKYIVRVRKNKDGSVYIEIGYPEDEFVISA